MEEFGLALTVELAPRLPVVRGGDELRPPCGHGLLLVRLKMNTDMPLRGSTEPSALMPPKSASLLRPSTSTPPPSLASLTAMYTSACPWQWRQLAGGCACFHIEFEDKFDFGIHKL
jgi:hypothetical protein